MAASSPTIAQNAVYTFSNGFPSKTANNLKSGHTEEVYSGAAYPCNGETIHKAGNWIPIREEVLWKPTRRLRVVSVGAGLSGKKWKESTASPWNKFDKDTLRG
jgi:hypothetical protein